MNPDQVKLDSSWKQVLLPEFEKTYMQDLKSFLQSEKERKKVIYPRGSEMFSAFNLTPLDQVKVVILGQDPYHGPNQAHGLCFSVKPGVQIPPSLLNIYKEIESDLNIVMPRDSGYLGGWAEQGVLLLNATLSVEAGQAGSHQKRGWEEFTDRAIQILNEQYEHLVFMLWGSYAQKKGAFIDAKKHLVLKSVHPSPLSAHRGFLGCQHFSKANAYLRQNQKKEINWGDTKGIHR